MREWRGSSGSTRARAGPADRGGRDRALRLRRGGAGARPGRAGRPRAGRAPAGCRARDRAPSSSSRAWGRTPATLSRGPCSRTRPRSRPSCRARRIAGADVGAAELELRGRAGRPRCAGRRPSDSVPRAELRSPGSCRSRWRASVVALLELYRSGLPFGPEEGGARPPRPPPTSPSRCGSNGRGRSARTVTPSSRATSSSCSARRSPPARTRTRRPTQIVRVAAEAAEAAGATLWQTRRATGAHRCSPPTASAPPRPTWSRPPRASAARSTSGRPGRS